MKNQEIAEILERMAILLEIKEELVFKVRAYEKAADTIANLSEPIENIWAEKRLTEIPGIGKTLAEKIGEYLQTGKMTAYENLIKELPASLVDICRIPSMGPKKAKLFFEKFHIKDIAGLKEALEDKNISRFDGVPGIKAKTLENIRKGLLIIQKGRERMDLGTATRTADGIVAILKELPEVKQIAVAGSLRRFRETIRDIDILIDSTNPKKVMDTFVSLPVVAQINVQGDTKSSILTKDSVQVDLRVVDSKCFGAGLLYSTGSKNFNVRLRQIAMKMDMKVSEYGVFSVKGGREKFIAGKTEEECLEALGLPYIPPELREDIGEEELFTGGVKLPSLVEIKDIQGELHVHSKWSDGRNTIPEMVEAARGRGYRYLCISDHSPKLIVAGGVSPENLKKKKKEIDELNGKLKGFAVLFGTEVEIDNDGNLDYNDKILSEFDVVIAAIHSGFEQSREQLTRRLVKACQNKYVKLIAHPTGVNLGKRDPYDIDFKEICKVAVDTNTFLEINASPQRLDLNSPNVYFARSQGVKFVINTDAHALNHFDFMKFGVAIARRGWLTKKEVMNTLSWPELKKAMKK